MTILKLSVRIGIPPVTNMIDLTNSEEIKKLDPKNVYGSTEMFPNQCEQIWNEEIMLDDNYKSMQNIVLCGMGGSAYGGYIAQSLFKDGLSVPIYSNNDYTLPFFTNEKSLIVLSSYSGETEEVLACGEEAKSKNFKITGITTGGKLSEFFKSNNYTNLGFEPKFNPSGQPRLGTGYMILGFFVILKKLGFINLGDDEFLKSVEELKSSIPEIKNKSIFIAKSLVGYIPLVFCAEFLYGNAHILRNQFNETSKSFSAFEDIPELNHHLMEGLKNPPDKKMKIIFITSDLYSGIIKKRFELTKNVIGRNNVEFLEYKPQGSTKISQVLNTLAFGGYTSFYFSLLYGQDPSLIPWVDYFKEELGK